MKNIILKSLTITNFKGIKSFSLENLSNYVSIYGANASGKTTIFDAFTFLLFGKDSSDRKDFEIKPIDKSGRSIDRTENEVSAILEVGGQEITIRHVMKEKWVKKRGESVAEFSGNEHLYFWNDVPMQAGEYQAKINDIIPEHIFKLLTNPLYFNSMKWQDRRAVLQEIAGEITDSEIIAKKPEFADLIAMLSGKTMKEIKAKNSEEKKRLKEALKAIPARIDELERSKPESVDEASIKAEIERLQKEYETIESQIESKNEAQKAENDAIRSINQKIHDYKTANIAIEAKHRQDYNQDLLNSKSNGNTLSNKISEKVRELGNLENSLNGYHQRLNGLDNDYNRRADWLKTTKEDINFKIESLRKLFVEINGSEINPNDLQCHACGRAHDAHNMEQLIADFNAKKTAELTSINERGVALKKELSTLEDQESSILLEYNSSKKEIQESIEKLTIEVDLLKIEIKDLQSQLATIEETKVEVLPVLTRISNDPEYISNLDHIAQLERSLLERPAYDNESLRLAKNAISSQVDELKSKLLAGSQIIAVDKRINELMDQEKSMSQELANIEKLEFTAESYERFKSEELERKVNGMFKYAKFKLFNQLINGGDEPTCITTYNGVPFPDLNNASKILVGIDIINTLSSYHGVTAPCFLDNRESVSVIPDTSAQVINLIVSAEDKELRVA